MNLKPGSRLGRFTIVSRLGSGGMGEIYLANDERVGRSVAIKVLPKHLQADADARVRFEREALAASSLNHPNILTIYEFGEQQIEGMRHLTRFIVSEFIDGETLRNLMPREKEGKKILEYLAQVADALAKAHSAGIIHRDLKPENIMITSDGYAKVLDFGLVKHIASKGVSNSSTRRSVTSGYVLGTVGYVSPEQASGQPIDHRSDIFAFGCILYEVLAGRRPFDAGGLAETLHHVIHRKPDPLPNDVPRDVRRIVDRCLAKSPDDRYPSMTFVAQDLRGAAKSFTVPAPAPRRTKTRSPGIKPARPSARIRSVAVLPFVNSSDNAEMDSLSDGLTERIILSLSQVQKLKVMARRTVFTFKGTKMTPRQIARKLRVGYVITGRVQQRGDELLVNIELVNARDGSQIWGDRYRRQSSDVLDLVEEIAAHMSENLKVQLSNLEKRRLASRPMKRSEAYKLYLQGRYQANRRTPEGVRNAIRSFGDAIAIDPNYALAWSGLADSYAILSVRALAAPEEGYANLEEAARRAVALDPTLAEPHATLAALQFLYYWNWPEAEKEYRQALELDAGYPTTHHWYSSFLASMGRHEESVREAAVAVDLDPLSILLNVHLADMLYYAGRLDESLQQTRRTLALDENFFLGHWMLGRLSEARGDAAAAAGHYEQAARLAGDYPGMLAALAGAKAATKDRDGAEKILADLQSRASRKFVSPRFLAEVHLALGDDAAALESLKQFFNQRGELEEVLVGPRFEKIRRDPGFKEMLKGVGFPETPFSASP